LNSLLAQELEQNREHHLELTLMAGRKGLEKKITHSQVQKMGLAMTGFIQFINPERLQIIGNTEATYFKTLTPEMQEKVIHQICGLPLSCLVVTRGLEIPELLLREAEERGIPLFRTKLRSFDFIERITKFLEEKLASTSSLHGVLMDVYGVGVLILGKSGFADAIADRGVRGTVRVQRKHCTRFILSRV